MDFPAGVAIAANGHTQQKNIGAIDRIIRMLLVIVVIMLYVTSSITGFAAIYCVPHDWQEGIR
jgi:hypothetical protein